MHRIYIVLPVFVCNFTAQLSRSVWSKRLQAVTVKVPDLGLLNISTPPCLSVLALLHILNQLLKLQGWFGSSQVSQRHNRSALYLERRHSISTLALLNDRKFKNKTFIPPDLFF